MKKLFVLIFLGILTLSGFSQIRSLPKDERGKYTFLEVSEIPAIKTGMMHTNAERFFKINANTIKLSKSRGDTAFYGTGKMILAKNLAGIGHPVAVVNYNLSIELRWGRYRLILTDFIVTPYERDRYANFVPGYNKYPLENQPGKLNRSEWNGNMAYIVSESGKIADKLKTIMSQTASDVSPEAKKPAVITTAKW